MSLGFKFNQTCHYKKDPMDLFTHILSLNLPKDAYIAIYPHESEDGTIILCTNAISKMDFSFVPVTDYVDALKRLKESSVPRYSGKCLLVKLVDIVSLKIESKFNSNA